MDRARKLSAVMNPNRKKKKKKKHDKVRQIFEEDWHTGWDRY